MSSSSAPAPSTRIDVVLEPTFWVKHRVTVIGIVVAGAVLVLGIQFMKSRARAGDTKGWSALASPEFPMQARRDEIDLNAVRGTTAEPWAMYQSALNKFSEYRKSLNTSDLESALTNVSELESKFSTHPVVTDGLSKSLRADIEAEKAWASSHPAPAGNPQPSDQNKVTIITEHGEIELGLYPDVAPSSVAAFLGMVRTADRASFAQGTAGYSVTLTAEHPEAPEDKDSDSKAEENPKPWGKDRNALTHVKGSISFMRYNPFYNNKKQSINVHFCLMDEARRDTQQVVFGVVTKGLDVLEKIAGGEQSEDQPGQFKSAVKVSSIRESAGLANIK